MGAIGDVFEVKAKYRDGDQRLMENVFFFRRGGSASGLPPTYASLLADAFNNDVITPLLALTPQGYTYYSIDVRNLFDGSDVNTLAINRPSQLTPVGQELFGSYITGKLTMSLDNGLVNKGRKMITGFFENMAANGVLTGGGLVNLAARGALFLIELVGAIPAGYVFQPVVVKRVREGTPGNYTYRLPANQLELIYGNITSIVASALQTSQVTRKD